MRPTYVPGAERSQDEKAAGWPCEKKMVGIFHAGINRGLRRLWLGKSLESGRHHLVEESRIAL